ncbi:hypothetical protein [Amycolatopsis sp. FDAARGOS 1241]|uniref:hypothetical protein n=1 Tax=Amycolatopsis sp. FDAARGOS 1241 TaxID=2778070 RepID=UPI00195228FF|nr:hypothetical protein [Amycolatopsis sp. FDAARGOS 1241]QRP45320.1 hypothetical protein I6J71_40235 [Amycolatopsis sp. FDAARGOS 1241]
MQESTLAELAFGDLIPPPEPVTAPRWAPPRQRLLAAIVLGGQGRYAAATTALAGLRRGGDPVPASLAASTLASHRRQLGGHVAARALDGAALSMLANPAEGPTRTGPPGVDAQVGVETPKLLPGDDPDGTADPDGLDATGARADALLGLAADNLALGRLAAARRFAARAAQADDRWRATVRGGWVGAEIELAAGRPREAVAPARRAVEAARARGSRRHIVKSDIVLGVALATAGDPAERAWAIDVVTNAAIDAEKYELNSLIWVATRVAADLGAGHAEKYRFRSREVLHAVLRRADPCVMRIALESPWVPTGPG